MSRDVASLVVGMNREIPSETLFHLIMFVSHHVAEITSPIEMVVWFDQFGVPILVAIDGGANVRQFSQQVHGVLIVVFPIFGFVHPALVGLEEFAVVLQKEQGLRQHCHGMHLDWQGKDEMFLCVVQDSSSPPFVGKLFAFVISRVSSRQKQEKHGLREGLFAFGCLLGFLAKLRDGVSPKSDTIHGVQCAAIVEHDWESPHSETCIIHFDLPNNLVTMLFAQVEKFYGYELSYFICVGGLFISRELS